jgi:hypothetical protein
MSDNYKVFVQNKTSEQILASERAWDSNPTLASYLQIAAQVRSNGDLLSELKRASQDSGNASRRIVWLTVVLAAAALLQIAVTFYHR